MPLDHFVRTVRNEEEKDMEKEEHMEEEIWLGYADEREEWQEQQVNLMEIKGKFRKINPKKVKRTAWVGIWLRRTGSLRRKAGRLLGSRGRRG